MLFTVKYKACPNPGIPKNGRRTGNDFGIGRSIRFTCQSGFKLTGSPVRKCLKNKQWSGTVAVCDDGSKFEIHLNRAPNTTKIRIRVSEPFKRNKTKLLTLNYFNLKIWFCFCRF